jgi:DNA-binding transcriptional LysR family regulator
MRDLGQTAPTLRQLELFLALATADGIAGAGAKLGMTPSATSHALKALESTLGTHVVDRNAPGVVLTYAGEQMLPHVRDVFAALQLIQATATASAGLKTGVLRIGSFGASSSLKLLPPLLQRFAARFPGVEVFVTEKPDAEVEQDLTERRIEIGVVTLPKPQFDTHLLATDELVAVLPESHPLAALATIPLNELAAYPLVLTHAGSQGLISRMFARAGIRPRVAHELSQLVSILEFVSRGQGISIVASLALPEHYKGVEYRSIAPRSSRRVGLACLNEHRLSPAAHAFWQLAGTAKRAK